MSERDVLNLAPGHLEDSIVVDIAAIGVEDRLRLVDRSVVEAIAASMAEGSQAHPLAGQHQPIAVSLSDELSNAYVLVDGEHRLEAAKLLGWTQIKAIVRRQTQAERRKHEIHANLIRAELTILDRNLFIGKLAEIHEAETDARHGGDRKSKKWREKNQFANLANWSAFSKEAARRTGLSTRSIDRARELSGKLSPDAVALIRGSKLADNQSQLQALAELKAPDQVKAAREIAEGRAANFAKARVSAGMVPAGGAVREADRPLVRFEPMLPRLSLADLQTLAAMVAAEIAVRTAPTKAAKAKKGGAA
ncbi:ParB N-terminal domain-containing protein [Bosea sp. BK604]|uniref:ParB/RepB/Spo0J family partition protein n=1 Tax=Bosea sp. BK604 TaxID=2512180 RepID=UPI00104F974F|nr:ParB N-terminal domain-containing protein [Bosea sp. BK604]TCR70490.1 ParB/RepB/Spo0J family partition protein [Bosea sp. BK604]